MSREEEIKNYFYACNRLVIEMIYLNKHKEDNASLDDLKEYNSGHLGTSMSVNYILANLYYFLNSNSLSNKIVIGSGHAGASLLANQYLSGTLEKYYESYSKNQNGINNLIRDFGSKIRSEINPWYPETIYDGGELGYSLSVAYGYAFKTEKDIVPCIIGDGEAETPALTSSLQLQRLLKTQAKVLPIINLNGLKMSGSSYLSLMSDEEIKNYYGSLGYKVYIVDAVNATLEDSINDFQNKLNEIKDIENPLLVVKTKKGFTLPKVNDISLEGNILVHKNPFTSYSKEEKLEMINSFLDYYKTQSYDFSDFEIDSPYDKRKEVKDVEYNADGLSNIKEIEAYLLKYLKENDMLIFSPDELISNQLGKLNDNCFSLLSEQVLQGMYQGYIESGNSGIYIAYEGFMMLISSMIIQYYKYLRQKEMLDIKNESNSLTYLLTSTCFENTYSHQNPDFVNLLLSHDDKYSNVLFPKDGLSCIECLKYANNTKDKINVITTSKRHDKKYPNSGNISIEIIKDEENPDMILCATGDYMLDKAIELESMTHKKCKIIYITNPRVLDKNSSVGLDDNEFKKYFNMNVPVNYLYMGNPSIIKSLLYERGVSFNIFGYEDMISVHGTKENNINDNMKLKMIL